MGRHSLMNIVASPPAMFSLLAILASSPGLLSALPVETLSSKANFNANSSRAEAETDMGLVMLGGSLSTTDLHSMELFFPTTATICQGPNIPDDRWDHTLDMLADGSLVVCGGYKAPTCIRLEPGSSRWDFLASIHERKGHTSWMAPYGNLILMGGDDTSGSMWEDNFYFTTEIVGGGNTFTLKMAARWQCAIPLATGSVLLTGGEGYPGYLNYVVEYTRTGFASYWPQLRESRRSHGCGVVGETLIVAGGWHGSRLSSTELLRPGASAWSTAASLPIGQAYNMRSAHLAGSLYLSGGTQAGHYFQDILRWDNQTERWTFEGSMTTPRSSHGMTAVRDPENFCTTRGDEKKQGDQKENEADII